MPLGGPDFLRGYKGYGLSLMVDIFSGILSGAAYGPHVGRPNTSQQRQRMLVISLQLFA
jgi:L-2-hydroxycarboxylate dehydrogenase (NAD+)